MSGVSITSSPASGDTYRAGETINVEVGFGEAMTVTGTPQLTLTIGTNTVRADYTGLSTNRMSLLFAYTLRTGHNDSDGIGIAAGALKLNGGAIRSADVGGVNAVLGLGAHAITNAAGHKVNGGQAPVPVLTLTASPATLTEGDPITLTLTATPPTIDPIAVKLKAAGNRYGVHAGSAPSASLPTRARRR